MTLKCSQRTTFLTNIILDSRMDSLVMNQILLRQERFTAIYTRVWTRSIFVCLLMRFQRVLRGETLTADGAAVRALASVNVIVLLQQISRSKTQNDTSEERKAGKTSYNHLSLLLTQNVFHTIHTYSFSATNCAFSYALDTSGNC